MLAVDSMTCRKGNPVTIGTANISVFRIAERRGKNQGSDENIGPFLWLPYDDEFTYRPLVPLMSRCSAHLRADSAPLCGTGLSFLTPQECRTPHFVGKYRGTERNCYLQCSWIHGYVFSLMLL